MKLRFKVEKPIKGLGGMGGLASLDLLCLTHPRQWTGTISEFADNASARSTLLVTRGLVP
jgi:hypothetical protein